MGIGANKCLKIKPNIQLNIPLQVSRTSNVLHNLDQRERTHAK